MQLPRRADGSSRTWCAHRTHRRVPHTADNNHSTAYHPWRLVLLPSTNFTGRSGCPEPLLPTWRAPHRGRRSPHLCLHSYARRTCFCCLPLRRTPVRVRAWRAAAAPPLFTPFHLPPFPTAAPPACVPPLLARVRVCGCTVVPGWRSFMEIRRIFFLNHSWHPHAPATRTTGAAPRRCGWFSCSLAKRAPAKKNITVFLQRRPLFRRPDRHRMVLTTIHSTPVLVERRYHRRLVPCRRCARWYNQQNHAARMATDLLRTPAPRGGARPCRGAAAFPVHAQNNRLRRLPPRLPEVVLPHARAEKHGGTTTTTEPAVSARSFSCSVCCLR